MAAVLKRFDAHANGEAGIGVIEIMVYTALMVIVMVVVSSVFNTLFKVHSSVAGGVSATQSNQLIANSVETGVRNASAVQLQTVNSTDQMVIARSVGSGDTAAWQCYAWYFDAGNHQVRFTASPTAVAPPTSAQLATWQLLGSKVYPQAGSGIFSLSGSRLSLRIKTLVGASVSSVPMQTTVSVAAASWVSAPCF